MCVVLFFFIAAPHMQCIDYLLITSIVFGILLFITIETIALF